MGLGEILEGILASINAAQATDAFILLIGAVFALAAFQGMKGKHSRFLDHAPAMMISLGILGTFVGIVLGLLGFDETAIDKSIPQLLAGLKTAFLSSLWGMLLSIAFKGMDAWSFAPRRDRAEMPDQVGPEHILSALQSQGKHLSSLKEAIAGSEEGSLVGQIKLLRTDLSDLRTSQTRERTEFETKLFTQFKEFADLLSKSATETVVEALRKVIVDFNKNLVEQFGDNFKRLDESVKALVTWQQQYKEHVDLMEERIDDAVAALSRTADSTGVISEALQATSGAVSGIKTDCQQIPSTMHDLRAILETNQHQLAELERHLQAFVSVRDKAIEAVPQIEQRLDEVSRQLADGAQSIATTMHEGSLEFGKSVDRTTVLLGEVAKEVGEKTEQIAQNLDDASLELQKSTRSTLETLTKGALELQNEMDSTVRELGVSLAKQLGDTSANLHDAIERSVSASLASIQQAVETSTARTQEAVQRASTSCMGAVEAQVRQATERAGEALNAQLRGMEEALQRELNVVFREMGRALSTISRRIADDHEAYSRVREAV